MASTSSSATQKKGKKVLSPEEELRQKKFQDVTELKKTADSLILEYLEKKRQAEEHRIEFQRLSLLAKEMENKFAVIRKYNKTTKERIKKSKGIKKPKSEQQKLKKKEKNERQKLKRKERMEQDETDEQRALKVQRREVDRNLERENRLAKLASEGSKSEYRARTPSYNGF